MKPVEPVTATRGCRLSIPEKGGTPSQTSNYAVLSMSNSTTKALSARGSMEQPADQELDVSVVIPCLNEEQSVAFGKFWKRRIRRLYPPYLIALVLFLGLTALTVGISVSRFFIYDVAMHLLMLHNLDPRTCYSINGVFWTLAIEEQLYLAYFLLLFLRKRWGWYVTLIVCLLARAAWMSLSHLLWLKGGIGLPVPEAAASHWFTWALGAIAVEAWFGLVKLPRWTRDLRIASLLIVSASSMAYFGSYIPKDTFWHISSWFLLHPLWGIGFFIVLNRAVLAEDGWVRELRLPPIVSVFATLGVFSYSIYLTHELTIMQSWRWVNPAALQMQNVFLITIPATIVFAWMFFWFCERPFMKRKSAAAQKNTEDSLPLMMNEPAETATA